MIVHVPKSGNLMPTQQGPACPISGIFTDERVVRLIAAQVVILSALAIAFPKGWFAVFLLLDFALRADPIPRLSPLRNVALLIVANSGSKPRMTDAAPKLFAARIGLLVAFSLTAFQFAGYPLAASGVALIMSVFAFLESGFGLCVGCILYQSLFSTGLKAGG